MGYYLEPGDSSREAKQEWLRENAVLIPRAEAARFFDDDVQNDGTVLLCAVDNGPFVAVGYIHDGRELELAMGSSSDLRPKFWFLADMEKVAEVCPALRDGGPRP